MSGNASWPTQAEVDAYVASHAPAFGIDPSVAVRVRQSESQTGFVANNGLGGHSYAPYQLDDAGLAPIFKQQTGLDASNPANWQATVDWSLGWVKQHGWGDFHGAQRVGISIWQGIGGLVGNIGKTLTYYFPVQGYQGNPANTYHTSGAADLFAPIGTAIRNVVQGRVSATGTSGPGGNNILIHGDDGRDYYYAHMKDAPSFGIGDYVPGGTVIGKVGNTGNAATTGSHLHLGIGYGIQSGTGPNGGAGIGFDAQTFLSGLLHAGGSEALPVYESPVTAPSDITGGVKSGVAGALDSVHQGIINYVQNRAAAMVLLIAGVFLILIGVWQTFNRIPIVKDAASNVKEIVGAAAMVA